VAHAVAHAVATARNPASLHRWPQTLQSRWHRRAETVLMSRDSAEPRQCLTQALRPPNVCTFLCSPLASSRPTGLDTTHTPHMQFARPVPMTWSWGRCRYQSHSASESEHMHMHVHMHVLVPTYPKSSDWRGDKLHFGPSFHG